jgi:hypothetical protein
MKIFFGDFRTIAFLLIITLLLAGVGDAGSTGASIQGDGRVMVVDSMRSGDNILEVHDKLSATLATPGSFSLSIKNKTLKQADGDMKVQASDYSLSISGKTTGTGKVTSVAEIQASFQKNPNTTIGFAYMDSVVHAEAGKAGTAEGSAYAAGLAKAMLFGEDWVAGSDATAAVKGFTSAYGKATSPGATVFSDAFLGSDFKVVPGAGSEKVADAWMGSAFEGTGKFSGIAEANGSCGADIHDWDSVRFIRAVSQGVAKTGGANLLASGSYEANAFITNRAEYSSDGTFEDSKMDVKAYVVDQGSWKTGRSLFPTYGISAEAYGSGMALVGTIDPETGKMGEQLSATDIIGSTSATIKAPGTLKIKDNSIAIGSISDSSTGEGLTKSYLFKDYGDVKIRVRNPPTTGT